MVNITEITDVSYIEDTGFKNHWLTQISIPRFNTITETYYMYI